MPYKDTIKRGLSALLIILVVLLLVQGKSNAQIQEKQSNEFSNKLDSYLRYMPSRSAEAISGKVEIVETGSAYSYEWKEYNKLPVKFSLGTNYVGIEDTLSLELPSRLIGLAGDIETTLPFFDFEETYLRIGISPSFYADDWNFESSSFRLPSRFHIIRKPNAKWTFLAGIAVYPDFENELLPVLGFIYRPNDRLTFNIVPKRPTITYQFNERIVLFGEGGGSLNGEYEVSRNGANNVVLHYRYMHLGAGVKLKINKFIRSSLLVGGVFNRSLKYRDNQGKVNIKDGVYTEFRTEIRF